MTLRDQPEFGELAESLKELVREGPLICIQNAGNWGDAMIGAGQKAFLEHHEIPVHHLRLRWPHIHLPILARYLSRQLRPTVLYGGNGGLGGHYPELVRIIRISLAGAGARVMLPATYGPHSLRILGRGGAFTFWARDRYESQRFVPNARFCHDMAFFLDLPPVETVAPMGNFFRTDRESLDRSLPPDNRDISAEGTEASPIDGFVKAIGQFEEVHTDRLHVAIVAALLGRTTRLYPNDYHKNAAIYRSSLEPFYPHVHFHGE